LTKVLASGRMAAELYGLQPMQVSTLPSVLAHHPPLDRVSPKEAEQNANADSTAPNYDRLATHGKEFKRLR